MFAHLWKRQKVVFRVDHAPPKVIGASRVPIFWDPYIRPHSNQILRGDEIRWEESFNGPWRPGHRGWGIRGGGEFVMGMLMQTCNLVENVSEPFQLMHLALNVWRLFYTAVLKQWAVVCNSILQETMHRLSCLHDEGLLQRFCLDIHMCRLMETVMPRGRDLKRQ